MKLEEVNPAIRARWVEVMDHNVTIESAEPDETDPGYIVVLMLHPEDAQTWGIFPALAIDHRGRVAEYDVSQPCYYPTFANLLQAAAVRTAAGGGN